MRGRPDNNRDRQTAARFLLFWERLQETDQRKVGQFIEEDLPDVNRQMAFLSFLEPPADRRNHCLYRYRRIIDAGIIGVATLLLGALASFLVIALFLSDVIGLQVRHFGELPWSSYAAIAAELTAALLGALLLQRFGGDLRYFFLHVLLNAGVELAGLITALYRMANLYLTHITILADFVILFPVLSLWAGIRPLQRRGREILGLYFVVWAAEKLLLNGWGDSPAITTGINWCLLIFLAIANIYLAQSPRVLSYRFWVSLGVIAYYTGQSLFLLLNGQVGMIDRQAAMIILGIGHYAIVLQSLCYMAAFALSTRTARRMLAEKLPY